MYMYVLVLWVLMSHGFNSTYPLYCKPIWYLVQNISLNDPDFFMLDIVKVIVYVTMYYSFCVAHILKIKLFTTEYLGFLLDECPDHPSQ